MNTQKEEAENPVSSNSELSAQLIKLASSAGGTQKISGKTAAEDVKLLKEVILVKSPAEQQAVADIDGNGSVDTVDLAILKKQLLNGEEEGEYPVKNPQVIDVFEPCTATIDDDFDDWSIRVTIKHQYSVEGRVWTVDDFGGVANIKQIVQSAVNKNSDYPYRQSLKVALAIPSKENVLKLIADIEALGMVEIWQVNTIKHGTGLLVLPPEFLKEKYGINGGAKYN
jgi:hypothetical protein